MDIHTLLYFKWITGEDFLYLLYSTGNSAPCCVAAWMKEFRENGDIRMAISLPCPPEISQHLLIGYTPILIFLTVLNDELKTRLKIESERIRYI